jgi:CRP-like cAMP-binding protein
MSDAYRDQHFEPGAVLFDTRSPQDHAFFILKGRARIELEFDQRKASIDVDEGEFVGDIAAVVIARPEIDRPVYQGRVIAVESVTATLIPIDDIRAEIQTCPPLVRAWLASFVRRVLRVVEALSTEQPLTDRASS